MKTIEKNWKNRRPLTRAASLMLAGAAAAGCGESSLEVGGPGSVTVSFSVASEASAGGAATAPARTTGPQRADGSSLRIEGVNGTLTLEEIHLIVAEVELDGDDDACEAEAGDDCADFEAPPRLLDLPLDGTSVEAFAGLVAPNVYEELEFEIEDLEDDEDDTRFAAEIEALRQDIRAEFPDWPDEATALVVGSFESTDGEVTPFRVYLDAEIEVERELSPPLVVDESGTSAELRIDIRPDIWFGRDDGSVLELHAYDHVRTGDLLELEVEMEGGFTEIELDLDG